MIWAALAFGGVCAVNAVTGASGLASWERRFFAAPALSVLLAFFVVGLCVMAAARLTPTQAGLNASQPARWLEIGCMALGVLGPIGGMAFGIAGGPRHAPGAWIILVAQLLCLPLLGVFLRKNRRVEQVSGTHVVAGLLAAVAVGSVDGRLGPVLRLVAGAVGNDPGARHGARGDGCDRSGPRAPAGDGLNGCQGSLTAMDLSSMLVMSRTFYTRQESRR